MANTRPSVNKRRKEANRREKKAAKAEKRAARSADKGPKVRGPGEVDPDIAGIVPGPQPLPWAEFADIEPEEEESDEQDESEGNPS